MIEIGRTATRRPGRRELNSIRELTAAAYECRWTVRSVRVGAVGCLLALTAGFFPRLALALVWIFGDSVDRAYDSWLLPLAGLIFLPLTTLVYALAWSPVGGVEGIEWFWVVFAFLLDLLSYGGGARARMSREA